MFRLLDSMMRANSAMQFDMSLAVLQRVMCVVRKLSTIVLRSIDGSCVLSLSRTYGSEHRTGIVKSPDGGFAFVDKILRPQKSRLSRRMVCHVFMQLRALTCLFERFLRAWLAPSRVILLCQRNEVPFHVLMIIAYRHEESSRDVRHPFIPEMEFWSDSPLKIILGKVMEL